MSYGPVKSILILQNEIMEYRKPVYNGLAESYHLVVLHSGRPSVNEDDRYHECLTSKVSLWRIHRQPYSPLRKMIADFDAVIAMFDLGWPAYLAPLFWREHPKYILWGHRYSSNRIACNIRDQLMKRADRLLMYGDEDVELMVARGVDPAKIVIAWNTIHVHNHQDFSNAKKTSLLFVGRLQKRKRIDLFIRIFARLQGRISDDITLDIIGSGEIENDLKQIADNLGILHKVNFHGRIDNPNVLANYYSRAYAYVSPGPVGLGVLHSLAYGVPVITMRDVRHGPEFYNLVHGQNSIICDDVPVVEEAILRICTDPALAYQLGTNAYQYYVRERPLKRMLEGFKKAIEE